MRNAIPQSRDFLKDVLFKLLQRQGPVLRKRVHQCEMGVKFKFNQKIVQPLLFDIRRMIARAFGIDQCNRIVVLIEAVHASKWIYLQFIRNTRL